MRPARPGRQDRLRSGTPLTLPYTAATVRSSGAQRGSDGPKVSRRSRPHGGRLARPAAATMAREHVCRGGAVWSARCAAPSPVTGRAKNAAPLGAVGQPPQQEQDDGRARVQPVERLRRRAEPVRAQSAGAQRQTLPPGALFQRCLSSTERRCHELVIPAGPVACARTLRPWCRGRRRSCRAAACAAACVACSLAA